MSVHQLCVAMPFHEQSTFVGRKVRVCGSVCGGHQSLVDSPHKGPVMQNAFPCHDSIIWWSLMWLTVELMMPRWLSVADPASGCLTCTEAMLSVTGTCWRWLQVTKEKTYKILMLMVTRFLVHICDWNSWWHGTSRPHQPWWIPEIYWSRQHLDCIDNLVMR